MSIQSKWERVKRVFLEVKEIQDEAYEARVDYERHYQESDKKIYNDIRRKKERIIEKYENLYNDLEDEIEKALGEGITFEFDYDIAKKSVKLRLSNGRVYE